MQDAAANIARIDPAQCRLPPGRLPIAPSECAHLIDSIRAHGQLVPGLVRRTAPGDPIRYEIICGARRHFAITTLGQNEPGSARPFFAAIRPLCDEAAFAAADRDNRTRADISDIQRALDYTHALDAHYGGHQDRMARAIQIEPSALSRYLSLATLPPDIFAAFGHPARLTVAVARPLIPLLKNAAAQERILRTAGEIAARQKQRMLDALPALPPRAVLHRLLQADAPRRATHAVATADGRRIAIGERRRNGPIHITVAATLPRERAAVLAATAEILDNLYDSKISWQAPTPCGTRTNGAAKEAVLF
jgi:ParB family chromosome partitioning protein